MTLWFHPMCAAYKRPEAMLDSLAIAPAEQREALERAATSSKAQHRLPRIDGAERAKGNAACRSCREPIPRGDWRIRLVYFDEGQFSASGFIHMSCRKEFFETEDILEQLLFFSHALDDAAREELRAALNTSKED